jgi:hypothetical protein
MQKRTAASAQYKQGDSDGYGHGCDVCWAASRLHGADGLWE